MSGNTEELAAVDPAMPEDNARRMALAGKVRVRMCPDVCDPSSCSNDVVYAVASLEGREHRVKVTGAGDMSDRCAAISAAFRGVLDQVMGGS